MRTTRAWVNPPSGILGNTNNKTVDRPFPRHLSFRLGRYAAHPALADADETREVHTRESFIEAQLDTVDPTSRAAAAADRGDLWFTGEAGAEGTPEACASARWILLAKWNGEMNEHMPEPLIAEAWLRALMQRLIQDELGPLAEKFTHPDAVFIERVYRDTGGASVWCDVIQSAAVETCTDIARIALDEALLRLTETYGRTWKAGAGAMRIRRRTTIRCWARCRS
jgi:penicillin amidase